MSFIVPLFRRPFSRVLLAWLALLTLLPSADAEAGCAPNCLPLPSTWLEYGATESGANYNANETTLNWLNIQTAAPRWQFPVPVPVNFATSYFEQVVVSQDSVYVTRAAVGLGVSQYAHALDLASGHERWLRYLGGVSRLTAFSGVAITNGAHVYVNDDQGSLWSLDGFSGLPTTPGDGKLAGSGTDLAPRPFPGAFAAPTLFNNTLYYVTDSGALRALSTAGPSRWLTNPGLYAPVPVTVGGGRVYALRGDLQGVVALDATSGATLWQTPLQETAEQPIFANGSVYVRSRDVNNVLTLRRIDAASGAVLVKSNPASVKFGTNPYLSAGAGLVLAQGVIEGLINSPSVVALDAVTLQRRWEVAISSQGLTGPVSIANDFALACDGNLRAWNLGTGSGGLFNLAAVPCAGQPVVAGGRIVYIDPLNKNLTALAPQ